MPNQRCFCKRNTKNPGSCFALTQYAGFTSRSTRGNHRDNYQAVHPRQSVNDDALPRPTPYRYVSCKLSNAYNKRSHTTQTGHLANLAIYREH